MSDPKKDEQLDPDVKPHAESPAVPAEVPLDPPSGVAPEPTGPVSGIAGPAYVGTAPVRPTGPRPQRSSEEIRLDIERQREELGQSVEVLRDKVNELTDWRGQIRKHRREIVIGAAAVGFAVGASMMMRRRRSR